MSAPIEISRLPALLPTGRLVQAGWSLLALLALRLALPGTVSFQRLLQTPYTGPTCLIGQLTPLTTAVPEALFPELTHGERRLT